MSETLRISTRPTVEGDEETLWLMLYYASHSDDEAGVGPDEIRSNPDLIGYIEGWRQGGRIGMMAESEGAPRGAAWLRTLSDRERANPVFMGIEVPELAIAVLPGQQSQGVGTYLLQTLLERADHLPGIVLSVRADNPAVRLYERFGFEIVETITNRVGTLSVKMYRPGEGDAAAG